LMPADWPIPFGWAEARSVFSDIFRKGQTADLYLQVRVTTSLRLEDDIIRSASRTRAAGTGIRVVEGESTGYSHCDGFDVDRIRETGRFAAAMATQSAPRVPVAMRPVEADSRYHQQRPIGREEMATRTAILKQALAGARAMGSEIGNVTATLVDTEEWILMVDSEGRMAWDHRPMITLSVSAQAVRNTTTRFGRGGVGGRAGFELFDTVCTPEEAGREAARQAVTMLDAKSAPAGLMPVVLAAGESGVLIHESVGHPLEADFVRKRASAYTGRIGEQVASELCSVVDDGTIPGNRGSLTVDDEAVPTRRTVLIENGRLVGFMHDRLSARTLNADPTGNGRRESYEVPPMPRMRTTYLDRGDEAPEDIIRSVKKGIYCVQFAGGQVNIASGDFVFVPSEAYLIENGKITAPVTNLTLIGNGPDVLTKVDRVGADFRVSTGTWICGKGQTVPVGIGMPTVRVRELTVGGASHAE